MADDQASSRRSDELASAIKAVKKNLQDRARWDHVEELIEREQLPEAGRDLYRYALGKGLEPESLSELGQRGLRFHETWFGESSAELSDWLERVLKVEPQAQWAFERLTIAYTVGERWHELLDAYDGAIAAADQTSRRMRLLEEAAQVAKDFASQPERAIGYMLKLHALDPDNAALAAALERLLERQERWEDLAGLWQSRLSLQSPKQAREARVRIAAVQLDKLGRYRDALDQVKLVLGEAPEHETSYDVLERLITDARAGAAERREALQLLRQRFLEARKPNEVVRVLELGLGYAKDAEQKALLRELVERLTEHGDEARAMKHQATLLALEPNARERDALRILAERTRDYELFADALAQAAEGGPQAAVGYDLLLEAGRTCEQQLGDEARAATLYERVFHADAPLELVADAGRHLIPLLEKAGREAETLAALARMGELEREAPQKRALLGRIARLAEKLGDKPRATEAWRTRLRADAEDIDALEALIKDAAEREAWAELVVLLEQRIKAPSASGCRRQDLTWLAATHAERLNDPDAAIDVWRRIAASFGEDTESVAALTDLLGRARRWPELAEVLNQAATHQIARFTELQTRLGDAYRERLDQAELAAQRYASALQVDPRDEAAQRGQHALLGDERCRALAVASLGDAYARIGDWKKTLELLEPRLSIESAPSGQTKILLEAAALYEQKAGDPRAALACLRRAFALSPDDRATEKEIRRLAERLGAWDAVIAAYRETIASFPRPTARVAELRHDEGKTLEERLHDRDGALIAYAEAFALAKDRVDLANAVARVACELGRYDIAAAHVRECVRARNAIVPELLATLESAAGAARGFDELCLALGNALAVAPVLEGKLARELYSRVARWHKLQRKDDAAAESALVAAVRADGTDPGTLRELADLQRHTPSQALCETLCVLAELERDNLDPLLEAANVAREAITDKKRRLALFQLLYDRSADMLRSKRETRGEATAAHAARFALEQLVHALAELSDHERAYSLLVSATSLPFDTELKREDLHRAAQIAAADLNDATRAVALYRDLLQTDRQDGVAVRELARLYEAGDQLPELLALRRHQLALERDAEQKLGLRLEIARILGELEARGGRQQALEDNLRSRPGHAPTLAVLQQLLFEQGKHAQLAEILRKQAKLLAQREPERGAELVCEAAHIYERELGLIEPAIDAYRDLYDLDPSGEATQALARLYQKAGQPAEAARWLELRLGTVPPDTRAVTSVELAEALLEAGESARARTCLEQALRENSSLRDARQLLSQIYRAEQAFEPLAALLSEGANYESDPVRKLALLREAAAIYADTLSALERAVDALERAAALAPEDRALHGKLAASLFAAGRFPDARGVLERLIEGFGKKRSPERAELHHQLARVLKAASETARAFEELDTATKMDPAHVPAMHMLAELSREQGELERAERTYRGLLMLVRRQKLAEGQSVGQSEIFFALSSIASARGERDKAEELLESAMEAATQSETEAKRFQTLLRERSEVELLLRLLSARLKRVSEPTVEAEILALKAAVLAENTARRPEALEALLSALKLAPDHDGLHRQTRGLCRELSELDRYLSHVTALADEAARKKDDAHQDLAARLTLRLGEAIEQELADLDRATGLYAKVEASGHCVIEAWMAMARVAGARGDLAEQRRVLQHIIELEDKSVSPEQKRAALFALLELELKSDALRDAGVATLERALDSLQDLEQPKLLLRQAIGRAPEHERLNVLFERVARSSRDHAMLLEHIERQAEQAKATFEQLREGSELALRIGEYGRAEALLGYAAELTKAGAEREQRTWVLLRLAECKKRSGDVKGAIAQLHEATHSVHPEDAEGVLRELAELAAGPDGELEVAASAYAQLLERDPTDRALWLPLLDVYRRLRDRARFEGFAEQCLRDLLSPPDRVAVHMARAKFLIEIARDERAAVPALKALIEEDPAHGEATDLLSQILQKHGMNEELAQLLQVHFDRARDEQNLGAIAELGLRIGELYAERRPESAIDVFRSALQWVPEHRGLLQALIEALGPESEPRERAEVMHALLKLERGEEAARLALQLAAMWSELEEPEQVQDALELGLAGFPEHEMLRDRLESFYAEHEQWGELASLLEREAERLGKSGEAVARLKNAASLYRERLRDLDSSATVLRRALTIVPDDLSLLGELARNLAAGGQHATAIQDVTRLLDEYAQTDAVRVDLLKVRAELRLETEQLDDAVSDLEHAYALAPASVGHQLVDALERTKTAAFTRSDTHAERKAVLRLMALHDESGDAAAAREVLAGWVEQAPDDVAALRVLRARDEADGRWEEVARSCERLLDAENGEARAEAAIALADAYERAQRPELARAGLERAFETDPHHAQLRARLRTLYERIDARRELAALLLEDARAEKDVDARTAMLQRAARLFLDVGDADAALGPLGDAVKLHPEDAQTQLLMIDVSIQTGKLNEAAKVLDAAIAAQKRKRSPELAALYQRMARLSAARGDHEEQLKWLNQAIEIDRKSGEIAAELAEAAMAISNFDVAMKALRAITMMDDPRPMSRALAFLRQAQIALMRGDPRRAQHWARKAKSLDEGLREADVFLAQIEG